MIIPEACRKAQIRRERIEAQIEELKRLQAIIAERIVELEDEIGTDFEGEIKSMLNALEKLIVRYSMSITVSSKVLLDILRDMHELSHYVYKLSTKGYGD